MNGGFRVRRIGVVVKKGSVEGAKLAKELLEYGSNELGVEMLLDCESSGDVLWDSVFRLGVDPVDVVIVIGGDGTLLRTLHRLGDSQVPIMTIRMGRRGFLLDVPPFEALDKLRSLVEGKFEVVSYTRLRATLMDTGIVLPPALNDVVVQSWGPSKTKVTRLVVYVDEDILYSVDGDGIIVATPIGSSAYALAAGGPVVDTDLDAIVVVPLAAMQFNAKPVVLSCSRKIIVRIAGGSGPAACVVDGQSIELLRPGDRVLIERAPTPAKIIRFSRVNSYDRLRYVAL